MERLLRELLIVGNKWIFGNYRKNLLLKWSKNRFNHLEEIPDILF